MDGAVLERGGVVDAVVRQLDDLRSGVGSTLFIVGEAGIGKSSLLASAIALASDIDVAKATADDMERTNPFGMADQILAALDASAASGWGEAPLSTEVRDPFVAVLDRLRARRRPVLIALDDLHWSDTDSLRLFAYLSRRCASLPVVIVATMRPWPHEAYDAAQQLAAAGHAKLERLTPLSPTAVGTMLERRLGAVTPEEGRRTWELCHGNPLLVEQVAAARERGEVVPDQSRGLREITEHLLLSRFAGLDEAAMRCARAASVLGTSFRPEFAVEAAGLCGAVADDALESLERSGLFEGTETSEMRFIHPLFAQLLYEDIAPALRRRLHARMFTLFVERGIDRRACEHAIRADLIGEVPAIEVLERVGMRSLSEGAAGTATQLLDAAVRFSGDRALPDLLLGYAEALVQRGECDRASVVCRRVLARDDLTLSDRAEALRTQGRAQYTTGSFDEAIRSLEASFDVATDRDVTGSVRTLLDLALAVWLSRGPAEALPVAARARALAHGDPSVQERADAVWGFVALECGDPDGIAAAGAPSRHLAEQATLDPSHLTWPWAPVYMYALTSGYTERYDDAERVLDLAEGALTAVGSNDAAILPIIDRCNVLLRRGKPRDVLDEALQGERLLRHAPVAFPHVALLKATALMWLGRLDESEAACVAVEDAASSQWHAALRLGHIRGATALWRGDPSASDTFLAVESLSRSAGVDEPCVVRWARHAIEAHVCANRRDDAERLIAWLDRTSAKLPCRWPRFVAASGRAFVADAEGDHRAADEHHRTSIALIRGVDQPVQLAEACLSHGAFLRRRGRTGDAREPLREAMRLAESAGATLIASSASAELRLAGGRRRTASASRGGLTAAELRVALEAKAGATNAEIAARLHLSVNTVESHLKRVFAKLHVSSRRELWSLDLEPATPSVQLAN